ncbi:MAG: Mce protein [Mycobacterium sp.]|nr:Mce protein [Mycobacterium sp.]
MEGQQPVAGDLSEEAPPEEGPPEEGPPEETLSDEVLSAEGPPAPTWLRRNSRRVALLSSVGLFVAAGAFAGATAQAYLMDRAAVALKEKVARTASEAITTLWSYTPADMDRLSERSAKYLGGDFGQQYRRYVDAIAPENKQAEVTSSTQVVAVAVESLRGSEATAIVYTNTTSTTPKSNNIPSLKYLSYRLELQQQDREWRVTKMTTVTSLDLTPKL